MLCRLTPGGRFGSKLGLLVVIGAQKDPIGWRRLNHELIMPNCSNAHFETVDRTLGPLGNLCIEFRDPVAFQNRFTTVRYISLRTMSKTMVTFRWLGFTIGTPWMMRKTMVKFRCLGITIGTLRA